MNYLWQMKIIQGDISPFKNKVELNKNIRVYPIKKNQSNLEEMSKIFGHYAFQHYMRVLLESSKQVLPKGINSDAATNVKSQIQ